LSGRFSAPLSQFRSVSCCVQNYFILPVLNFVLRLCLVPAKVERRLTSFFGFFVLCDTHPVVPSSPALDVRSGLRPGTPWHGRPLCFRVPFVKSSHEGLRFMSSWNWPKPLPVSFQISPFLNIQNGLDSRVPRSAQNLRNLLAVSCTPSPFLTPSVTQFPSSPPLQLLNFPWRSQPVCFNTAQPTGEPLPSSLNLSPSPLPCRGLV